MRTTPDKDQMFSLIEQWKKSELSQKSFCIQHELRYYIFHYWYKRYRNEHKSLVGKASSFIPIKVNPSLSSLVHTELVYPDGKRVLFHQPVDAQFLRTLLG